MAFAKLLTNFLRSFSISSQTLKISRVLLWTYEPLIRMIGRISLEVFRISTLGPFPLSLCLIVWDIKDVQLLVWWIEAMTSLSHYNYAIGLYCKKSRGFIHNTSFSSQLKNGPNKLDCFQPPHPFSVVLWNTLAYWAHS